MLKLASPWILSLVISLSAFAGTPSFQSRSLRLQRGGLNVRTGIYPARGPVRGDILFLIGFADRLDNHGPLFQAWNDAGFRVISFDYPSHGETRGILNHLNFYGIEDLAKIAQGVERNTREDETRPLLLSGWSTGGLLAVRLVQGRTGLLRKPRGLILFSPGVSVYPLVGDRGFVTQKTLTSNPNPPHLGPIQPRSPLFVPAFSASLLAHTYLAQRAALPNLPILVFTGGDKEDVYVKTKVVQKWVLSQRSRQVGSVAAVQCKGAWHELDNEPEPVGGFVRGLATLFATSVIDGTRFSSDLGPAAACQKF
jgi:alpha-beta hydrolase superfamily lysophospholipase